MKCHWNGDRVDGDDEYAVWCIAVTHNPIGIVDGVREAAPRYKDKIRKYLSEIPWYE